MSDKQDNSRITYEERLAELESRLNSHANEEGMLGDVGQAIRKLLSVDGASESHIRQILERQFDQGNLRRESYELVEKMLGKIVAEKRPPVPERATAPAQPEIEEGYTATAVLDQPGGNEVAPVQLQAGSVLRDRYLLKQQVAEGSMGSVYKALDRRLAETGEKNPFVAVKALNPKLSRNSAALRALQQEAAKGRYLSHPNIVRFIDLDREDDLFFIVMEWLEGRSLAEILDEDRGNAIDLDTAVDIVRQTSRALSYAHQRGVVHADVKPGNIIITPDGQVKLIDFGVARVRQKENEGKSRFDPNVMRAGSPAYSSMQVLTGEEPVPADDVFSLACLMYRLIAGYRVFGPRNAADAAEEGMEPQQPQELSAEQWQVLKKALSYSRVTRYESPQAFMDAFAGAPAKSGKKAPPAARAADATAAEPPLHADRPEPVVASAPRPVPEPELRARPDVSIGHDQTTEVAMELPIRARRDGFPDADEFEIEDAPRRSPWRLIVLGAIMIAATAVVLRTELVGPDNIDRAVQSVSGFVEDLSTPEAAGPQPSGQIEALPEPDVGEPVAAGDGVEMVEDLVVDPDAGTVTAVPVADEEAATNTEAEAAAASEDALPTLPPPVDFSQLPQPDLLMSLRSSQDPTVPAGAVAIREGAGDVLVDFIRQGDLAQEYTVQLVELPAAGDRPLHDSGSYVIDNAGSLTFEPGQPRARIAISAPDNAARESDRQVTLGVTGPMAAAEPLARITLTIEDDDLRAFEAGLPPNTVGFLVNQMAVRESDPAVQVDVVRYRLDGSAFEVNYTLIDVTATEGQDYFSPGLSSIYFAPGQRAARILIPLGQDARTERDESFLMELNAPEPPRGSNIFSQIAVTIRDDDT